MQVIDVAEQIGYPLPATHAFGDVLHAQTFVECNTPVLSLMPKEFIRRKWFLRAPALIQAAIGLVLVLAGMQGTILAVNNYSLRSSIDELQKQNDLNLQVRKISHAYDSIRQYIHDPLPIIKSVITSLDENLSVIRFEWDATSLLTSPEDNENAMLAVRLAVPGLTPKQVKRVLKHLVVRLQAQLPNFYVEFVERSQEYESIGIIRIRRV